MRWGWYLRRKGKGDDSSNVPRMMALLGDRDEAPPWWTRFVVPEAIDRDNDGVMSSLVMRVMANVGHNHWMGWHTGVASRTSTGKAGSWR